jgi:hypothetical protein
VLQKLENFGVNIGSDAFTDAEMERIRDVLASKDNLRLLTPYQNRVVEHAIIKHILTALEHGQDIVLSEAEAEKTRAQMGVLLKLCGHLPPRVVDLFRASCNFLIDPRTGRSIAEDIPWDDIQEQAEKQWNKVESQYVSKAADRAAKAQARRHKAQQQKDQLVNRMKVEQQKYRYEQVHTKKYEQQCAQQ